MATDWEKDISADAQEIMKELGNFSPTTNIADATVKGWMDTDGDGLYKTYWTSATLRKMSTAFVEVAEWLDRRAKGER